MRFYFSHSILLAGTLAGTVGATYQTVWSNFDSSKAIRLKHFAAGQICDSGADHYTGWADIDDIHLFFWFHEARSRPAQKPLLLWLAGGPGGPGSLSSLIEHGPCVVGAEDSVPHLNPYAWTEAFNVIYIDQPVGTGWSYYTQNTTEQDQTPRNNSRLSSLDLVAFLKLFGEAFPAYAAQPLHLGGGAFGARSAIMLAESILEYNDHLAHEARNPIPLSSVLLENGFISPRHQVPSTYDVGCHPYKGLPRFFDEAECHHIEDGVYDRCQELLMTCEQNELDAVCHAAGSYCFSNIDVDSADPRRPTNQWDRRDGNCFSGKLSSSCRILRRLSHAMEVLNSVLLWQHIEVAEQTEGRWKDPVKTPLDASSSAVLGAYTESGDVYMSTLPSLQRLLGVPLAHERTRPPIHERIPVLAYNGVADLLGNPVGVQRALDDLPWARHAQFRNARWHDLPGGASVFDSTLFKDRQQRSSGRIKGTRGLYLAEIEGAGHFTAADQPASVLAVLKTWLRVVEEQWNEENPRESNAVDGGAQHPQGSGWQDGKFPSGPATQQEVLFRVDDL